MTARQRGLGRQLSDLSCVAAARRGGAGDFTADRRSCAQETLVVKPGSSQRPSHLHGAPDLESRGTGPALRAVPHLALSGWARREQVGVRLGEVGAGSSSPPVWWARPAPEKGPLPVGPTGASQTSVLARKAGVLDLLTGCGVWGVASATWRALSTWSSRHGHHPCLFSSSKSEL